MNCENCGIPDDAYVQSGYPLVLAFKDELDRYGRRNYQKRRVWVCGSACAMQTMAIAAMGLPTHKWHMSLKEFTSQMKTAGKIGFLTVRPGDKPPSETRINSGFEEVDFENMNLPHTEDFVPPQYGPLNAFSRGGRPRVENPGRETRKKRRQRERQQHDRKN